MTVRAVTDSWELGSVVGGLGPPDHHATRHPKEETDAHRVDVAVRLCSSLSSSLRRLDCQPVSAPGRNSLR